MAFAAVLETAGIRYVHRGETLGGYRTGGYAAPMETDPFRQGWEVVHIIDAQRTWVPGEVRWEQGRCAGRRT